MKIILDVMGGDHAPEAQVLGGLTAAASSDLRFVFIGDEPRIREIAEAAGRKIPDSVEIVHTEEIITMEDSALSIIREKKNSSMAVGLTMRAEGNGDALVSAGNTGALHAGSSLIVRRIPGIRRSAIATILPFARPTLLIDSGANLVVEPEQMHQFAMMGSIYMKQVFGLEAPTVGLLNNGKEKSKGSKELQTAYALLQDDPELHFVGNVEGNELPFGVCDVLVTDGFTGNILLKSSEGLGKFLFSTLKKTLEKNPLTRVAALTLRGKLHAIRDSFDASEYGGAPLLGLSRPVIKMHGSSDAREVENALLRAADFARTGVTVEIAKYLSRTAHAEEPLHPSAEQV